MGVEKWEARSGFHFSTPHAMSHPRLRCWGFISQRRVRPDGVVVDPPAFGQHTQFLGRVEDLPVQELISKFAVERFAVAVLPWSARLDVQSLCSGVGKPFPQILCNELPLSGQPSADGSIVHDPP
jgi:hypothetical protein